jgi:hypothetical protein
LPHRDTFRRHAPTANITAVGYRHLRVARSFNDGTEDIFVTVYDMSTRPQRIVVSNARINGFTSVPILLIADADGKANLEWTATSTDVMFPKCGRANIAVANAGAVNVHVDSECGA